MILLVFYSPSIHFSSFRARSVILSSVVLGSLLGCLPVLSAHSFASNWQLPFLNQRKGENGRRNYFMTSLHETMLPDVRIEPMAVCIPGGRAYDWANVPSWNSNELFWWPYEGRLLEQDQMTRQNYFCLTESCSDGPKTACTYTSVHVKEMKSLTVTQLSLIWQTLIVGVATDG